MKKRINSLAFISLLLMMSYACTNAPEEATKEVELQDELLTIRKSQYAEEGMQLGDPEIYSFEEIIKANGRLMAAPDGVAEVNTHISGIVKMIKLSEGDYVKKGQLLCQIEGNEVIMLQQEYQELSAGLKNLKSDYERIKILSKENISSQKELLSIESNYKSALAKHAGMKSRLELLNLNPEKVEKGNISSTIKIIAPIRGYVANQNCVLGQFVDSQKMLMKIVDITKLQLEFNVFEKDILKLKKDQALRFYSPEATEDIYGATLAHIGKSIDSESKTIKCIAQLNNKKVTNFVDGMFVMTEVISNVTETIAVPSEAILIAGDDSYILAKQKEYGETLYFKKHLVKTGVSQNGYTSIKMDGQVEQILIKGIYNLLID